jgi:excisionase family DNA binding protein
MPLMEAINLKDLMPATEAAERLGISRQAIHQAVKERRMGGIRIGRDLFVSVKEVEEYKPSGPHMKINRQRAAKK